MVKAQMLGAFFTRALEPVARYMCGLALQSVTDSILNLQQASGVSVCHTADKTDTVGSKMKKTQTDSSESTFDSVHIYHYVQQHVQ